MAALRDAAARALNGNAVVTRRDPDTNAWWVVVEVDDGGKSWCVVSYTLAHDDTPVNQGWHSTRFAAEQAIERMAQGLPPEVPGLPEQPLPEPVTGTALDALKETPRIRPPGSAPRLRSRRPKMRPARVQQLPAAEAGLPGRRAAVARRGARQLEQHGARLGAECLRGDVRSGGSDVGGGGGEAARAVSPLHVKPAPLSMPPFLVYP